MPTMFVYFSPTGALFRESRLKTHSLKGIQDNNWILVFFTAFVFQVILNVIHEFTVVGF